MTFAELQKLNGRSILVRPTHSTHNPPIGVRGTIQVTPGGDSLPPLVEIVLTYPDMMTRPAEKQVLRVSPAEAKELLRIEADGDCTFLYDGALD